MMGRPAVGPGDALVVDRGDLDSILDALRASGYRTLGPVVREGAITIGEIESTADLPEGWHDAQGPGSYRLEQGPDEALFSWAVGPHSLKSELFPSRSVLWRGTLQGDRVVFEQERHDRAPVAFFGARPCEVAALAILDRVLGAGGAAAPAYSSRRDGAFIVAAECGSPSGSCFCASMGTGPAASTGFDLALTELLDGGQRFVVRVGSQAGADVLEQVPCREATAEDLASREAVVSEAEQRMGRTLDTDDLPAMLARNIDNPHWDDVAARCLACGNCTLVCPTCFCSTVSDTSGLDGSLERTMTWSSCFDLQHSYLHGGSVRSSTRSRYRQWLTHKLSTWHDQFGTSGCVGCGRCVTWCPVGIDITAEAAAIRATDVANARTEGS
jgi:sulfhydrogenase subunit beta (sulfur reductase)